MRVFATNANTARSRFWYFMSQLNRLNKTAGEVVACTQVHERHPGKIKNFGMWFRFDSRTGTHNAYKEFRDLTVNGAVTQLYQEMGARHRVRATGIQIIKISEVTALAAACLCSGCVLALGGGWHVHAEKMGAGPMMRQHSRLD